MSDSSRMSNPACAQEWVERKAAALKKLREARTGDAEGDHLQADRILLDLIDDEAIRDAFDVIDKWYA